MVYNYKITNSAYDDIDRALDYIANKLFNVKSAKKLYDEMYSKIRKVCTEEVYTKDCSNYGIDDETIRRINAKRYILILKIDKKNKLITILRLLHETQDIEKILNTHYITILLYANALLCDNKFIKHTDTSSRRIRRAEQIAAYTYQVIAEAYGEYSRALKHGRDSVISVK